MIKRAIFREYDIRGQADTDLNDDNVYTLGRAFGTYYRKHDCKKILIGADVRLSSPRISKTLARALNDSGCDVISIGSVPTPLLYFSLFYYNIGSGIMITASHNPKEFNGFKVCIDKSTIYGTEIQGLYDLIEEGKFIDGKGKTDTQDIIPMYIDRVLKDMKISPDLKIIFDCGNGTSGPIVETICGRLKLRPNILFKEPDGNFPNHLPDPTVIDHIQELIAAVKQGDYDCGIGFDGDGDRIGVLDETGSIIWGDVLLAVYAEHVLQTNPGAKIIFEVKCSKGLVQRIEELGGKPIMYRTGHSLIKAKMKEENSPLAGEMSGHVFFADRYYGYDDAIYAGLRLLEIISNGEKLSARARHVPKYFSTPEIRVNTSDEKKFEIVKQLTDDFKKKYQVLDIDGARVDFKDGWGLVRASNTQPVLVLRFEAETENRLNEIKSIFLEKLEAIK